MIVYDIIVFVSMLVYRALFEYDLCIKVVRRRKGGFSVLRISSSGFGDYGRYRLLKYFA